MPIRHKDIKPGDIILTSPAPNPPNASRAARLFDATYGRAASAVQGSFTHAMMATGDGKVLDTRPEIGGIRTQNFHRATKGLDYVVLRPKVPEAIRHRAVHVMKQHIGKPYSYARAGLTAGHLLLPSKAVTALEMVVPHKIEKDRGVQCTDAIASSYRHAGYRMYPASSLVAPPDLLAHHNLQVVGTRVRSGTIKNSILPHLRSRIYAKMSPHVKVAAPQEGAKPGDIVLVSPSREPWVHAGMSRPKRLAMSVAEKVYRSMGPRTLGHFTHAGIIGPHGTVIEALDRVKHRPLHEVVQDSDYMVLRPPTSSKVRRLAAAHAHAELGKPYSPGAMLASGANTLLPAKAHRTIAKTLLKDRTTRKSWMCGGLVADAYRRAGHQVSNLTSTPLVTPGHLAAIPNAKVVEARTSDPNTKLRLPTMGVLAKNTSLRDNYLRSGLKIAAVPGLTREKRRAMGAAHAHLSKEHPDWNQFLESAKKKSFVKAIQADPRADDRLRRHVDQMSRLQTGKTLGKISGEHGTYNIIRLRGGGLGCTCNDWRYRKSVAPKGEQECKHIKEFKTMAPSSTKTASTFVVAIREGAEKRAYKLQLGGAALGAFAGSQARKKKRYDENLADYSATVHGAMSPEQYKNRQMQRARQGLADTLTGAVTGAVGGHLFKTVGAPKLLKAYEGAKKEVSEIAGQAGRRAAEESREPVQHIIEQATSHIDKAMDQQRKKMLDETEERAARHLAKIPRPRMPKAVSSLKRFIKEE